MRKLIILAFLTCIFSASASFLKNVPQQIALPDGTKLHCFATGDEYRHWLHDSLGYTIVQSPEDGYFYYASLSGDTLVPSAYKVYSINPSAYGFKPGLSSSRVGLQNKVTNPERSYVKGKQVSSSVIPYQVGRLNNIVVFIRFPGDPAFSNKRPYYDSVFNSGYSLKSYYQEVSYQKLNIRSYLYPVSTGSDTVVPYVDYNKRAYYQPYNSVTNPTGYANDTEKTARRTGLLKNALNFVVGQISDTLVVDKNSDGRIDNLCFILEGYADGWSDLIWPHRSSLEGSRIYVNGAYAYDYTFQVENTSVTTLCHEMFHGLGAPDLYHYSYDGLTTVGNWDLMESGFVHMGAYMKCKYSDSTWIQSIPEIKKSGRYSLKPLYYAEKNAYMFKNKTIDSVAFFVVEYRKALAGTYEKGLPGTGLLVYRINPRYNGNASGPPDEVYLFRPNGTTTVDGSINLAAKSNISGWVWGTKAAPLFYGDGVSSGMKITDISEASDSISFNVVLEKSSEATINSFYLMGQTSSVINKSAGLIYCNVSATTNLVKSKPILSFSELSTISPASGVSVDLTNAFTYTVTAEDGTSRPWIIYADKEISTESNILSFDITNVEGESCTIDHTLKTVTIVLPWGTDLSNLRAKIVGSKAVSMTPDPYVVTDYRTPVTFVLTAENGTTTQWVVNASLDTGLKEQQSVDYNKLFKVLRTDEGLSILNLSGSPAKATVYSITGQKLFQKDLNTSNTFIPFTGNHLLLVEIQNDYFKAVVKSMKE